ncbi:MAG: FAD-dependent tricarballylate dehydrogenase TcuA [Nitrospinaceae bacterium]|jgi:tricarballylate dehydrogenase|nr:FAD-dependent tricarballylate dehydrogenase TcuA [Nitrospinaceae bacterium]MBT3432421.1 FAD-dependent tricarballylate dehydrogenase TcuA [Nitrospinaceae bacterium]MBT3822279.1 FAD-dependent tricarballylate dehydrogenase TcuA [Nitrospinaceae bacterium]MBT4092967.1 FAD-dependent tricarballylate dehydrogenase TcuA [Nitrospinaceae bacterium]MBT5946832.1 FAD-dependent tricarballylate dehydrogenase TcuA [Nitrospinaceae bacterium]
MSESRERFDVIVVGCGNAALSAALSAKENGANVLVLEKAPEEWRGGNSYFTGGLFRFAFDDVNELFDLVGDMTDAEKEGVDIKPYTSDDFFGDLYRLTDNMADPDLASTLIFNSLPTMKWLREKKVRFVLASGRQAFNVDGKLRFWGGLILEAVGGGVGLVDFLIQQAERDEIEIRYATKATGLLTDKMGAVTGVEVRGPEGPYEIDAGAIVLGAGGFQANTEMRCRYLGPDWELAKVRGTPYNTGDGIQMGLTAGAQSHGHWSSSHTVQWDLGAPPFGDRKVGENFQKHSYPFGLIVNIHGQRFVDEGADFRNYTYAEYGRRVLKQPSRIAWQIFDQKCHPLMRDEYRIREVTKHQADTIEELAQKMEIDVDGFVNTIEDYNAAVQDTDFNPTILDGKKTVGIEPPKSNWAQKMDAPPYEAYGVTAGITFTFGGLKTTKDAQVLDSENRDIPGLFACGEMMGGLFYYNYPGGSGLMSGAVFGKLAGEGAARHAAS